MRERPVDRFFRAFLSAFLSEADGSKLCLDFTSLSHAIKALYSSFGTATRSLFFAVVRGIVIVVIGLLMYLVIFTNNVN